MITFRGGLDPSNTHGSGMHSLFNASTRNITQKNFNDSRQVKNILAIKEKVLASNFIENPDAEIQSSSYIPSLVKIPAEIKIEEMPHVLSQQYIGIDSNVSKFQSWQDTLKYYWDKPIVKLSVSFGLGLLGIVTASHFIKRAMAQKIGSKAKNFNEIKSLLDKQISENLDDVAISLEKIANKLLNTANQDMAGNTKLYQQMIDFSNQFKSAAASTKAGKLPGNLEYLFASLKSHFKKCFSSDDISKLSPQLKKIAEQFQGSQQLPAFARNININDDLHATIINAIQDPTNVKNVQAVMAVLGITTVGAVGKRFVDGVCDIVVKQKEADISRDLQEAMISIETRAFSGKNNILRRMIAENAQKLKDMADNNWQNNYQLLQEFMKTQPQTINTIKNPISFTSNNGVFDQFNNFNKAFHGLNNSSEKKSGDNNKKMLYVLMAAGGLLTVGVLYIVLRNIAKTVKMADTLKKDVLKRTQFLPDEIIEIMKKDTPFSIQDAVFGNPTKIGLASYVEGVTGFLYTYIMNKTPETLLAFLAIVGATGGGYLGSKMLDAAKDIQVKRVNAETERRLQERLVEVELKNFIAKKNSLITPLINEYEKMVREKTNKTELNKQYNLILDELRNGPPFIYA
ncbi:MAG: hypothetical protein AB1782_00205 [Cyanobacteriota bacterium]